jgi:hypothetical protein
MEQFWKWLMKTDAKALFGVSLAVLAGVLCWCAFEQIRGSRQPAAPMPSGGGADGGGESAAPRIGILDFIEEQFSPDTLIVPVNPFHPTFEEIVRVLVEHSESGEIVIEDENGNPVKVHFENGVLVDENGRKVASPFQRDLTQKTPTKEGEAPERPRPGIFQQGGSKGQGGKIPAKTAEPKAKYPKLLRYRGVMQRPDGQFAAYVAFQREDGTWGSRFAVVGDVVEGATIKSVGAGGMEVSLEDGGEATLNTGDPPIKLP